MIFKPNNLPSPSQPWGNQVEGILNDLLNNINIGFNQTDNTTRAQASTLQVIGDKLGSLATIVSNLSISASQITAGTFVGGVILPGGQISGNVGNTLTGTLIGTANSGGTGRFDGGLYSTDAYSFNMTGTRVAGWHQIDGHIGTASSSRRYKTNIVNSMLSDPSRAEKLLDIMVVHYNYIAEVAKRDDPNSPDYAGPDFHVHTEVGMIAEDLDAAGFWEFVIYEHEPVYDTQPVLDGDGDPALDADGNEQTAQIVIGDKLKLNSDGKPIPASIHYEIFSVGVLAALQCVKKAHDTRLGSIEDRLAALEGTK